jgi:HlyD family secretion protein
VITLDEEVPNVRPGFTCTAEITTATRQSVTAVPIQSLTVRELLFNEKKELVKEEGRRRRGNDDENARLTANEPPPGHTREEVEGVFLIRDGKAAFTPVKTGVAGERYFEVLDGLTAGDQVITGPFASVRELDDGEDVKLDNSSNDTNNRNNRQ